MLGLLFADFIAVPLIVLAVAQFPLYGLLLGAAAQKGRFLKTLVLILAAHAAAAVVCFLPLGR